MSTTSEPSTKESRPISKIRSKLSHLPSSVKPIRPPACSLKFSARLTRLRKSKKLLLRLLLQPEVSKKRKKSMFRTTSFLWMLLALRSLSCNLRRLRLMWLL